MVLPFIMAGAMAAQGISSALSGRRAGRQARSFGRQQRKLHDLDSRLGDIGIQEENALGEMFGETGARRRDLWALKRNLERKSVGKTGLQSPRSELFNKILGVGTNIAAGLGGAYSGGSDGGAAAGPSGSSGFFSRLASMANGR